MVRVNAETPPRARRLIVTAREARALLAGATQVRRLVIDDNPEWIREQRADFAAVRTERDRAAAAERITP